jgi:beta-glucosidase/6-phospho-beta-glucosidase/beta-galactosidase
MSTTQQTISDYFTDIARIAALGVGTYSFSISWSRIFPFGRGVVNEEALAHYQDVIDTCIQYGVEPSVTLFHWDLPLYLQNLYGGWLSEEVVGDYVEYARVVFGRYGNQVHRWFTVNEPVVFWWVFIHQILAILTDLFKVMIIHYQMVISVRQAFLSSNNLIGVVIMFYLLTEQPTA